MKSTGEEPAQKNYSHTHTHTKAVLNRMARVIGHMQSVKRMVEEGRDCSDVLIQISAVDSALKNVGKLILRDHMEHCMMHAIEDNDMDSIEKIEKAIDQFVK